MILVPGQLCVNYRGHTPPFDEIKYPLALNLPTANSISFSSAPIRAKARRNVPSAYRYDNNLLIKEERGPDSENWGREGGESGPGSRYADGVNGVEGESLL